MKLWEKKYQLNKEIEKYTVGTDYLLDQKLLKYDCQGSVAHTKMLNKIGILTDEECNKIIMVLYEIIKMDKNGSFIIEQTDEDCHTAIENYLVKKLGDIGKKIHTGRSRNDQVLTALRLYYKDEVKCTISLVDLLLEVLTKFKNRYGHVKLPGYTHMQKAMPSSFGLWCEAFVESMNDNKTMLNEVYRIVDQSPLGTGAGYGVPIKVDRELTAKLLGFNKIQNNPIYVQNSRGKFESSILHVLSQVMLDLNKISMDLLFFSIPELGFVELSEEFCTGSSIMPHKKNLDVLELTRAKYHQVVSCEFEVKSVVGNLISGYNRDIQLTKKPVFDGFEIAKSCLKIMALVLENLKVNKKKCNAAMTDELYSVERAYDLVSEGVSFRSAYFEVSNRY